MTKDKFCDSPMDYEKPPAGYRGGPGQYNGEKGYPGRTSSPNAVPEKVRDENVPDQKGGISIDSPAKQA